MTFIDKSRLLLQGDVNATVDHVRRPPPSPSHRSRRTVVLAAQIALSLNTFLIVLQNHLFMSQKLYMNLLGQALSVLDGLVPMTVIGICMLVCLGPKPLALFLRAAFPFLPFALTLALSIVYFGFVGKGLISLVESFLQVPFIYLGLAASSPHPQSRLASTQSVVKYQAWLCIFVALSDLVFVARNGVLVQSGAVAGRYNTSFGSYVTVGYFASVCIMVLAIYWLWKKTFDLWTLPGIGLISAVALLLISGARTPLVSLMLALFAAAMVLRKIRRASIVTLSLAVGLALGGSLTSYTRLFTIDPETGRPEVNLDLTGRQVWYGTVIEAIGQHPFFGAGWGAGDLLVLESRGGQIYSVHSQHLQLLHDVGIIGYLFFAAGILAVLIRLWSLRRHYRPDSPERLMMGWAFGFVVHLEASMLTDSVFPASIYYGCFGCFLVGLALRLPLSGRGRVRIALRSPTASEPPFGRIAGRPRFRRGVSAGAGFAPSRE